jgi:hypothetical protein
MLFLDEGASEQNRVAVAISRLAYAGRFGARRKLRMNFNSLSLRIGTVALGHEVRSPVPARYSPARRGALRLAVMTCKRAFCPTR